MLLVGTEDIRLIEASAARLRLLADVVLDAHHVFCAITSKHALAALSTNSHAAQQHQYSYCKVLHTFGYISAWHMLA
jgi:hypothetical protein